MRLGLLYLFTLQETHAIDVACLQHQVEHLTRELDIISGKNTILSTDVAGKEDGIILLENQLKILAATTQKTINKLRAEAIIGSNTLQRKADQINLIEAEFRLAKKWISATPTFRAKLQCAKD